MLPLKIFIIHPSCIWHAFGLTLWSRFLFNGMVSLFPQFPLSTRTILVFVIVGIIGVIVAGPA
jgi:hypothetical protein